MNIRVFLVPAALTIRFFNHVTTSIAVNTTGYPLQNLALIERGIHFLEGVTRAVSSALSYDVAVYARRISSTHRCMSCTVTSHVRCIVRRVGEK